jgi:hypothetical protein
MALPTTSAHWETARSRTTFKAGRRESTTCSHPSRLRGDPNSLTSLNDRYLHLGFKAPLRLVLRPRVRAAWAILRMRHPLLASHVVMQEQDYENIRFVYVVPGLPPISSHTILRSYSFHPPTSPEDALAGADCQLDYRHQDKDGMCEFRGLGVSPLKLTASTVLIDSYLNGPRTLSSERLSYLIVSHTPIDVQLPTPPSTPRISTETSAELSAHLTCDDRVFNHELLICAGHFIGDGMALHQFANDFFGLLGGGLSQEGLDQLVADEWKRRWEQTPSNVCFQLCLYYSAG